MLESTQLWLNSNQAQAIPHYLSHKSEIPDWLIWGHPDISKSIDSTHAHKAVDNQVLHFEQSLMFDEAQFVRERIKENDAISIIDVGETSGTSSLPFIYELLAEESVLGAYMPATVNAMVNKKAILRLKNYLLQSRIVDPNREPIDTQPIQVNFQFENPKEIVLDVTRKYSNLRHCNLFLMLHSFLGNTDDPEVVLRNIYHTMTNQDYFVVLQGIYNAGSESVLVSDYTQWFRNPENFAITRDVGKIFNPQGDFVVEWDDRDQGIAVSVVNQESQKVMGVDINEGQKIQLLRSRRFSEKSLLNLFEKVGFRTINITYDPHMYNAMYFLKKS